MSATTAKPKAKKATKTPRAPKVSATALAKLEAALDQPDAAAQCAAIAAALPAKPAAAAAAVLAATKKGTPVARAYLETVAAPDEGPVAAADVVVRACAKLERGRKRMRAAFVTTWRRASDMAAVDAAYRNFARVFLEDPEILLAGFEAARRLGNPLAAAERITVVERARELAPIVEALQGRGAAQTRARGQLALLPVEAQFHVHARIVAAPAAYPPDLAVEAIVALTGDSRASDTTLFAAAAELDGDARERLVEAWRVRVAAGDEAVINRLLALFEWTALRATNAEQFAMYIRALHAVSARRDVFAQIEVALASDSAVAREAVLRGWLCDADVARQFSGGQIDTLMRSVIAIAEGGREEPDQVAAEQALLAAVHPGATQALVDAIRNATTKKNNQLRPSAYRALARIDHAAVTAFLIEQLFVENQDYVALGEALMSRLDVELHQQVLATLASRAGDAYAVRAAAVYAALLATGERRSPRLLAELARAITAWQPRTNDDARRLRFVFEHATLAAIATHKYDDARALLARARELPDKTYADYYVIGRDEKTPSPFAATGAQEQIAALESRALDEEFARERDAAETARAAKQPTRRSDAELGALAGVTVTSRLLDDTERGVVWFFDEVGELHAYDGYGIVPLPFQAAGTRGRGIADTGIAGFLGGKLLIDERATFVDEKSGRFRAVVRIADRVLVFDPEPIGLKFTGYVAARDAVSRFGANPPPGMTRVGPWYVDDVGAVRRTYRLRDATAQLAIIGSTIVGRIDISLPQLALVHASHEAAVKAYFDWEGRLFASGGRIVEIVVDPTLRKREDTLVAAFLDGRQRDEDQGAAWHLRGLEDMLDVVHEAGLGELVPDLVVWLGPAVGEEEIAGYQAMLAAPVPDALAEVWHEVGGGGFECERTTVKFLTPREVSGQRAALRAALEAQLRQRLKGKKLDSQLARLPELDVIATRDGAPLIVYDTQHASFAAPGEDASDALVARIAEDITGELRRELEARVADIHLLRLGSKPDPATRRTRLGDTAKGFEAVVAGTRLLTRTFGAKGPSKPTVKTFPDAAAASTAFDAAVAAARKKLSSPAA